MYRHGDSAIWLVRAHRRTHCARPQHIVDCPHRPCLRAQSLWLWEQGEIPKALQAGETALQSAQQQQQRKSKRVTLCTVCRARCASTEKLQKSSRETIRHKLSSQQTHPRHPDALYFQTLKNEMSAHTWVRKLTCHLTRER